MHAKYRQKSDGAGRTGGVPPRKLKLHGFVGAPHSVSGFGFGGATVCVARIHPGRQLPTQTVRSARSSATPVGDAVGTTVGTEVGAAERTVAVAMAGALVGPRPDGTERVDGPQKQPHSGRTERDLCRTCAGTSGAAVRPFWTSGRIPGRRYRRPRMRKYLSTTATVTVLALACMACSSGAVAPPPQTSPTAQPTYPPALGARGAQSTPTPSAAPQATLSSSAHNGEVRLRLAFVPGDTRTLTSITRMTFDSSLAPAGQKPSAVTMNMAVRYKVIDVSPDGSATVTATFDTMDIRAADGATTPSELVGIGVRMRLRPDGSFSNARAVVDDQEVAAPDVEVDRLAELMIPFRYPVAPLRVGGTFDRDIRLAFGNGLPETVARTHYTLVGTTTRDGIQAAQLQAEASFAVPAPSNGAATVTGTDYVNIATGWPQSGDQVMTMSIRLQSPDNRQSGTMSARTETSYTLK